MGNRSSSIQPAGPPPPLSAAVMGDLLKFQDEWNGGESLQVLDRQQNNVLHALFSCRGRTESTKCDEILDHIHSSVGDGDNSMINAAYEARNNLGCTPLWILVAYGNVDLLKRVRTKFEDQDNNNNNNNNKQSFLEMLMVPNNQGDSPLLATSSQGNTDMVRYLKEEIMTSEQFTKALSQANQKGTTPLQIIVGNGHIELLQFLLSSPSEAAALQDQLLQKNAAGLSLFHICSERNAHEVLQVLLDYYLNGSSDNNDDNDNNNNKAAALEKIFDIKDKNGATGLHVAAFCGNEDTVKVWMDVVQKTYSTGDDNNSAAVVDLLDKMDSQARTPYWLAMVQGRNSIGQLLAEAGVDTAHPNMVKEINSAQKQREERAAAGRQQQQQQQQQPPAFLGR